ncbi:hypothetical protein SAMN04489743_0450 [Pseudarthrobacter equi]|uniref:Uncharacterized protein n=2 Tax=Pseudarthrobacter equi TaxID=728066 RepID=A0A1H1TM74_9MICC|nr:hypothetical protein SAMN04489743_0450 [Pseudarthrobacter equi]
MEEDAGYYEIFYKNATNQIVENAVVEIVDLGDGQLLDEPFKLGPLRPGKSDSLVTAMKVYPDPVALRATFRDAQGISWTRFMGKLEPEGGAEQPSWWKSLTVDWERLLMAPIPALALVLAEFTRDVGQVMAVTTKLLSVTLAGSAKIFAAALVGGVGFVGQTFVEVGRAAMDLFRRR